MTLPTGAPASGPGPFAEHRHKRRAGGPALLLSCDVVGGSAKQLKRVSRVEGENDLSVIWMAVRPSETGRGIYRAGT